MLPRLGGGRFSKGISTGGCNYTHPTDVETEAHQLKPDAHRSTLRKGN